MDSLPSPAETALPLVVEVEPAKPTKINTYASKKSVAQRMMDIALLTSNSNQLRYVIRYGKPSASLAVSITLIALSLSLQVAVGIFMIFKVKSNASPEEKEKIHNIVVGGVFLITIVNVLVTAFSLEDATSPALAVSTSSRVDLNLTDIDE